jgi:hypothetical protein
MDRSTYSSALHRENFSEKDRGGDPPTAFLVATAILSPGEMIPGREDDFTPTYHRVLSPRRAPVPKTTPPR